MRFLFENLSRLDGKTDWVFVGMPAPTEHSGGTLVRIDDRTSIPWVREPGGIRALVTLRPGEVVEYEMAEEGREPDAGMRIEPEVLSRAAELMPRFYLGQEMGQVQSEMEFVSDVSMRLHCRYHWRDRVTVELWLTLKDLMTEIEFVGFAVYGDTRNDDQPQMRALPRMRMESNGALYPQFASERSHVCTWNSIQFGPVDGWWHRCRRYEVRGVLRSSWIARDVGLPIVGLYLGWNGNWGALGKVPAVAANARSVLDARKRNMQLGLPGRSRDRAQPAWAGTTGEQPDFGAMNDVAVTMQAPWEIYDALYHCESFALRPTCNREPDGSPMRASLHPNAVILGQRPDLGYGLADRLGWPGKDRIGEIPGYVTSGAQHHCVNLLVATWLLTRDPMLKSILDDHVELYQLEWSHLMNGIEAARAEGRTLLAQSHMLSCGFPLREVVERHALKIVSRLSGRRTPVVTWGGNEEAKYGWRHQVDEHGVVRLDAFGDPLMWTGTGNSVPVFGWQPWQESILVMGMVAASRALGGSPLAAVLRREAERVSNSVVTCGFFRANGALQHAYALRWASGNELPARVYNGEINGSVYPEGSGRAWCRAAILFANDPHSSWIKQVLELETKAEPATMDQSRWWAV